MELSDSSVMEQAVEESKRKMVEESTLMVLQTSRYINLTTLTGEKERFKSQKTQKAMISRELRNEIQKRFRRDEQEVIVFRTSMRKYIKNIARQNSKRVWTFLNGVQCFKRMRKKCSQISPKNCIISYKSAAKKWWDGITIILSIYNALFIPCQLSFAISYQMLQVNSKLDLTIDMLFLLDNLLMFITTFQDKLG